MKTDHFSPNYLEAMRSSIEASELIMKVYSAEIHVDLKQDGSPVTKADLLASKSIFKRLSQTGIPILCEEIEIVEYETRRFWKENWCVDPLDGTKMFINRNDEFSVNIAHIVEGSPVFGLIASPVEERILIGGKNLGVYIVHFSDVDNPEKWSQITPKTAINKPFTITCSRGFDESKFDFTNEIENEFGKIHYLRKGSALKFFNLADQSADMYLRFAPTMEWDIAAGQAILEELGGSIVEIETGESLHYNKENLFNPYFVARTKPLIA